MKKMKIVEGEEYCISRISNYYGDLTIKTEKGKFYWSIENYNGHHWEEIPPYLFRALVRFEKSLD
jgi:hypothetical protein